MIYHEALDQVVLMGGKDLEQTFSDTWTWNGSEWVELEVKGPAARSFHAMTYDVDARRAIVYGGRHNNLLLQDLWSWRGGDWKLLAGAGPLRRGIHASAYDPHRKNVVIHGSGDRVNGKWVLEASTWTWSEATGWMNASITHIVALRLAGKLDEARKAAEAELLTTDLGPRTELAVRLELARIHDRIGLHTNTRPVHAALRQIERGSVAASYAYYYYRAEAAEGSYPRATEHVELAIALLREGNDLRKLSDAVHLLGLIHLQKRELDRAQQLFDESLELDERAGVRKWFLGEYHRHVAFVRSMADDWEAALPHFEKSLQFRKQAGATDASLFAGISLGTALIRTGRPAEAQPYLDYAVAIADEVASPVGKARACLAMGEMSERLEDLKKARIFYETARLVAASVEYTSLVDRAEAALRSLDR
jgi:tetratricopeptide (TPR) repeat protein